MPITHGSIAPHSSPKDPEALFKQELKALVRPGILKGHLIVSSKGQLSNTHIFEIVWQKFKGAIGFSNRADNHLVESKVLEFLTAGRKWVDVADVSAVRTLAEKVRRADLGDKHVQLNRLVEELNSQAMNRSTSFERGGETKSVVLAKRQLEVAPPLRKTSTRVALLAEQPARDAAPMPIALSSAREAKTLPSQENRRDTWGTAAKVCVAVTVPLIIAAATYACLQIFTQTASGDVNQTDVEQGVDGQVKLVTATAEQLTGPVVEAVNNVINGTAGQAAKEILKQAVANGSATLGTVLATVTSAAGVQTPFTPSGEDLKPQNPKPIEDLKQGGKTLKPSTGKEGKTPVLPKKDPLVGKIPHTQPQPKGKEATGEESSKPAKPLPGKQRTEELAAVKTDETMHTSHTQAAEAGGSYGYLGALFVGTAIAIGGFAKRMFSPRKAPSIQTDSDSPHTGSRTGDGITHRTPGAGKDRGSSSHPAM